MISAAQRARILVLDDDPGILRAVSRIFQQQHEVVCADSGAAALQVVGDFLPDVAIVDLRMPELDGLALMKRLHTVLPDLDVIIMTGNVRDPDANLVQAIDAGAFYFIQKPFERRVLLALVSRCLDLRRIRAERLRHVEQLERELDDARHFPMAAMMTGIVKSAFHAARSDGFDPLGVVNRVREGIRAFDDSRFITLCAARLEVSTRRLTYANAGHPPVVVHRPGGELLLLESTAPLICAALSDLPCDAAELGPPEF